ncbi:hypothetical protein [Variovorax sp. HJSM1_2]
MARVGKADARGGGLKKVISQGISLFVNTGTKLERFVWQAALQRSI